MNIEKVGVVGTGQMGAGIGPPPRDTRFSLPTLAAKWLKKPRPPSANGWAAPSIRGRWIELPPRAS